MTTNWTSFDDKNLVFDSYNKAVDSTIVAAKVQAHAYVTPTWIMEDDFIPQLPEKAFTLLVEEAKSMAFINLKQMVNEKAEQRARKHDSRLSRSNWVLKGGIKYRNFGRGRAAPNFKPQPLDSNN